jgi:hypothetical protein
MGRLGEMEGIEDGEVWGLGERLGLGLLLGEGDGVI